MNYLKDKNKIDGGVWKCKICKKSSSLRHNSIFENYRISMKKIFKLIIGFAYKDEICNLGFKSEVNRNLVSDFYYLLREIILNNAVIENDKLGGFNNNGDMIIVEMDESYFFKRKYNRGRLTDGMWIVGGIERGSKKAFLTPVLRRNTEIIRSIILNNIKEGTIIYTDEWKAYRSALLDQNFIHGTVNHTYNFVNPLNPLVHTQNIECLWSHAKKHLREKYGINHDYLLYHFSEFLWRYSYCEKYSIINNLLILIKKAF